MAFDGCAGLLCETAALFLFFGLQSIQCISYRLCRDHDRVTRKTAAFRQGPGSEPDEYTNKPGEESKREEVIQCGDVEEFWQVNLCDDQYRDEHAHDGFSSDEACADEYTATLHIFCGLLGQGRWFLS